MCPPPQPPTDCGRGHAIALQRSAHARGCVAPVISPNFLADLWNQLTGAMVLLTGVISSVGLLVGGIGVMNIMLISVTERTQEIGVRKAIGARRGDIRAQFLLEAVVVTLAGGILGILLGAAIAFLVRHALPSVPAAVSYFWVMLGVAMSVAVGIFFGYYPANRAANLDPIIGPWPANVDPGARRNRCARIADDGSRAT